MREALHLQAFLADCIDCPKPSCYWLLRVHSTTSENGDGFANSFQIDMGSAGRRRQVMWASSH